MRLKDKVAVVTGGGRGIGEAIVYRFAREGASVVVASRSVGEEVARRVEEAGGKALFVRTDVSDPASVRNLFGIAVDSFGGIDILINNAALRGRDYAFDVQEIPLEAWREMFAVNLDGALLCAQEAARQMISQGRGGRILNISSLMGYRCVPKISAYSTAKRALMGLTSCLATELIPYGIVVNCIALGWIGSGLNVDYFKTEEFHDRYIKTGRLPIGRGASVDEVAGVAAFFAGDDCSYVVGQTLVVDGGVSLTV
jgi:NAD(P)-dependent dehydrogenase (short-subunit alcohol dehydrogenase family)